MRARVEPARASAPMFAISLALALTMPCAVRAAALAQVTSLPPPARVCAKSGEKCGGVFGFLSFKRVECCDDRLQCGFPSSGVLRGLMEQFCVLPDGVARGGGLNPADGPMYQSGTSNDVREESVVGGTSSDVLDAVGDSGKDNNSGAMSGSDSVVAETGVSDSWEEAIRFLDDDDDNSLDSLLSLDQATASPFLDDDDSDEDDDKPNVSNTLPIGPIVGGAIGGVAALALVVVAAFCLGKRRRQGSSPPDSRRNNNDIAVPTPQHSSQNQNWVQMMGLDATADPERPTPDLGSAPGQESAVETRSSNSGVDGGAGLNTPGAGPDPEQPAPNLGVLNALGAGPEPVQPTVELNLGPQRDATASWPLAPLEES